MMKLIQQLQQLERLDALIRRKSTGSPKELARKFSVSERTVYNLLEALRQMGAEIEYCHTRCSYYYTIQIKFGYGFVSDSSKSLKIKRGDLF
ncbi:MAG: HTH domain-containing protein [Chitinophagales bacterium]|nr:HTH domain-containing protein [Chitinophagales bacterium]